MHSTGYRLIVSIGVSCVILRLADAMKCPPCEKIHCSPRLATKLDCKGGVTTGVCGCCPVCARVERETCGGYFNYIGTCDTGLYCQPDLKKRGSENRHRKGPRHMAGQPPEGLCKRVPVQVKDQPPEQRRACRPKCTPAFCTKHPRAICSALDAAEYPQPCQHRCQHTSCNACKFLVQPSCRKCEPDDFRCMRKFGKCMRRQTCSRRKFPCKEEFYNGEYTRPRERQKCWLQQLMKNWRDWRQEKGKFQCFVPECR